MHDDVLITVRGEHRIETAPERATVHLAAVAEGTDRGAVAAEVTAAADALRGELSRREADGAIVEWTSEHLAVWSERPWSPDGRLLDPVHHATVDVAVTVADIGFLDAWTARLRERPGIRISGVTWELTPHTRAAVEQEAATRAVAAARTRAEAYAAAAGCTVVTLAELADLGLLAGDTQPAALFARAEADAGAPGFRPAPVVVTGAVEARFRAR